MPFLSLGGVHEAVELSQCSADHAAVAIAAFVPPKTAPPISCISYSGQRLSLSRNPEDI